MGKLLNKVKSLPRGVKAAVGYFFASIITSGISYLVTPIYTRILSPEVYGQTSLFMTWLHIFGILAMFCLNYGVFNNGMVDYPDKRDDYSFSMLILANIITLAFTIVIVLLYPLIKDVIGLDLPLVLLMCGVFFFQPAYLFWTCRQRYELKYKLTVLWTVLSAFLSPIVAVTCVLSSNDASQLYARLFGAELTLIIIYIFFYIHLGMKNKWKVNTSYWKFAFLFNLPLIPHYLSTYLLSNSNKILISNIISDTANAYYSVAQSVAMVASIVWTSVNSAMVPYTYENCKTKNYSAISRVTMPILTAFAGICVAVMMFAPEVVSFMATKDYMEAIYVIPPIIAGVFFQVQYYIYANVVYYYKKPRYVMYASIISVVVNLVLGYILISKFGYLAAGYVTLVCYLLQATIDYFAMRKVVDEPIYNMRHIGLLSFGVIFFAIFTSFLYGFVWIRYVVIAIILVLCVVFRKKIIDMFKIIKKK